MRDLIRAVIHEFTRPDGSPILVAILAAGAAVCFGMACFRLGQLAGS